MAKLFANSGDPHQMLHYAASDLGLHCLQITLLKVSRLQWVIWSYDTCTYMYNGLHLYCLLEDQCHFFFYLFTVAYLTPE